jgi:hypothetical protein
MEKMTEMVFDQTIINTIEKEIGSLL